MNAGLTIKSRIEIASYGKLYYEHLTDDFYRKNINQKSVFIQGIIKICKKRTFTMN